MPAGGLVTAGVIGAAGIGASLYANYKSRKSQEKAADDALEQQNKLMEQQMAAGRAAAQWGNEQVLAGSQQGQDQLRQSMGDASGAIQQGFTQGRRDLGQYYNQGQGYLRAGDDLAMRRLAAGQQASQGTLERAAANSRLAALMDGGLASGFQTDPGYQFRLQQGEKALQRQAAAAGGRIGTRSMQSLSDFNSGLASQEYGNYANRAIGMAGQEDSRQAQLMGLLAQQQYGAGQLGASYGQNYGTNMAQGAFGMGSNMANMATGQGSALGQLQMTGGNNLAQMMYGTGQQLAANELAGTGMGTSLVNNMMQQYNNPVGYAGAGWDALGQGATAFANLGGTLAAGYGQYQAGQGNIAPATGKPGESIRM